MAKSQPRPLMIGDKLAGTITIDLETGKFEGELDKDLADILDQGLKENLLSVSFFGKPASPMDARTAQRRLREWTDDDLNRNNVAMKEDI